MGIKQFYDSFPNLADTEIGTVVRWYKLVVQVAAAHGIYVHPYECFHSDAYVGTGLLVGMTALIVLIQESCMTFRCGSKAVVVVRSSV